MSQTTSNSRKHSTSKKKQHKRHQSASRTNYFEEISSMTKSKIGEILLTIAEDEQIIEQ